MGMFCTKGQVFSKYATWEYILISDAQFQRKEGISPDPKHVEKM